MNSKNIKAYYMKNNETSKPVRTKILCEIGLNRIFDKNRRF
jgi:hypothetical protein